MFAYDFLGVFYMSTEIIIFIREAELIRLFFVCSSVITTKENEDE